LGKAGDADTQFLLWLLYVNDLSISKPKAYVWIKKAAFNKQPRATFALGLLYYYGYIVPEQKSKAIKLFEESSALGYSFASTFLNK
jgi:TPR repeat protein